MSKVVYMFNILKEERSFKVEPRAYQGLSPLYDTLAFELCFVLLGGEIEARRFSRELPVRKGFRARFSARLVPVRSRPETAFD